MKLSQVPIFITSFFCWEDIIDPCFCLSVPYFGHLPGLFFQVFGSKGATVPLAEALLFHFLGFLMDKGADVRRNLLSSSCDGLHTKIHPSVSFSVMYQKLCILRMNGTNSWYGAHTYFLACFFCLGVGLKTSISTIR